MTVASSYNRALSAALALSAIFAVSCATARPSGEAASGEPIVIGAVLPLTGYGAVFGASALNGMRLAFDEANAKGGVLGRPLELRVRDDKGDITAAADAFHRSVHQDRVVAVLGSIMSRITLEGARICQPAGVPLLTPTSTNPAVTETGDFIFRAAFIDPYQGTVAARFALDTLGARTAACVFTEDDDYARSIAAGFRETFESGGGVITAFEGHGYGVMDYSALLRRVLTTEPELILISDYYNDAALISLQARALGYSGHFMGGDGWNAPDILRHIGRGLIGSFFVSQWHPAAPSETNAAFVAAYRGAYGSEPDAMAALGYDSARIVIDAIERAGSTDGAAIRDAILSSEIELATGLLRFDSIGDPIKSAAIIRIEDGAFVFDSTVDPPRE
ncbi:MAG: ABC transporter substrate-binding protein [Spirochaetales bacterium]|nr:ABC transporter substrate-binding protein [Spirochaetales bacterium]